MRASYTSAKHTKGIVYKSETEDQGVNTMTLYLGVFVTFPHS
jgi:hypothetical protein